MKTIVISGGTDGMGKALAMEYLGRGDNVVVLGRDPAKGAVFAEAGRATFIQADLGLVARNREVVGLIAERFPVVDALVLCARHFRSARVETAEGIESTFALEYLSRHLLGHGLAAALGRAERPVIVNVSGPGTAKPEIRWHDVSLTRGYQGVGAQLQAGRANDLLGVAFAAEHAGSGISYVLLNPGGVATSFSGDYDAATAAHVEALKRYGKPVEEGIVPIIARIDDPPAEPLSAFVEGRRIAPTGPGFEPAAAKRLAEVTRRLLAEHGPVRHPRG
ncbi:oxidoreductase [Amycolatopsis sp. WAC 01376]|uniref:SDR family NAD(P)-dependent oxidoreductase n=1 Tax=Amycolatopsis sp. WAC 01376 TaxID=2203195 RepID=UPI000F7B33BE|nr:SDR family NAD(P)-dependent oxidoreductase [Amycolatopsis sp. WAC 01376]RSM62605.1 oxidoreductase [Amycolatopsis sp. WAC 01376]